MKIVKWVLLLTIWTVIASFLHYTLPQKDIVRVTDTENRRVDFGGNSMFWAGADSGNATQGADRDVFFIQTVQANGDVMVYRNEDTALGWPPYFKFDTQDLQTEAADLRSTPEAAKWAMITHYGWRNVYFTIYPNAISIVPVSGPDAEKPIPWVNIAILSTLLIIGYGIWVRWRRFRENRIDPTLEEWQDNFEAVGDAVDAKRGRFRRWLNNRAS